MNLAEYFSHWDAIHADTLKTVGKFTDGELSYAPYTGSWTVGEVMLHIANAEDGWFRFVVTGELPGWPTTHTPKRYPTVSAIQGLLSEVHDRTMAFLREQSLTDLERPVKTHWGEETTLGWIAWHVLEHEIHHRGELSLVLGLFGREGLDV